MGTIRFEIEMTEEAIEDMHRLRRHECRRMADEIEAQLAHQAEVESRNRKRLRPNRLAEWEMRLDPFRIFYDVDTVARRVKIVAVGRKAGNHLFVHGEEFEL